MSKKSKQTAATVNHTRAADPIPIPSNVNMNMNVNVEQQLDGVFQKFFAAYNELVQLRKPLFQSINDGHFSMENAKYSLSTLSGASKIDSTAYSGRDMESTRRIHVQNDNNHGNRRFTVEEVKSTTDSGKALPIQWFTILPPPTLSEAQAHFTIALEHIAQYATLVAKCNFYADEFEKLQNQTSSIKNEQVKKETSND